ncbi:zinc finger and BTB domain-containing protein 16-like [Lethenteron reissneri]|uniref:zinc finger and BTB domain-containing protein 16-like n=1 Tax=Lethenteron reissneri TaxID=7753 RepID=UPI002AB6FA93|nr:zinc finger and BTB domain-containing protein 16-like [Lethenteron reissneri]
MQPQSEHMNTVELRYVDYPTALLLRMNELRIAGHFCDVTVEVDGVHYRAHRSVLAGASRLFENLFTQHQSQPMKLYRLDFLTARAFGLVLEFLYTASLKVDVGDLEVLRSAAQILQLGPLEQVCGLVLQQGVVTAVTSSSAAVSAMSGLTVSQVVEGDELMSQQIDGEGQDIGDGGFCEPYTVETTAGFDVQVSTQDAVNQSLSDIEKHLVSIAEGRDITLEVPQEQSDESVCKVFSDASEHQQQQEQQEIMDMLGQQSKELQLETEMAQPSGEVVVLPVNDFDEISQATAEVAANGQTQEVMSTDCQLVTHSMQVETPSTSQPPPMSRCFVCGLNVSNSTDLGAHLWKEHLLFNEGECKICGKVVNSKIAAQKHLLYHAGERKLECATCGEGFAFKQDLLLHKRKVHGRGKSYMCDECGRVFRCNGNFIRHLRVVHKGQRPHVCEYCGQCFADVGNLTRHLRRHLGVATFQCSKCEEKCETLTQLKLHLRTHIGVKPFECKICQKRCRSFSSIRAHIAKHNGCQAFKCTLCEFVTPARRKMEQHMKSHKPDDVPADWAVEQTTMFINHEPPKPQEGGAT